MSDSIEELATQLDEFASEQDAKSEASLPAYSAGYRNEAKLIRAAALKLRECREALEPFASDSVWLFRDRITDDDLRRAAKALEAK